jgi:hypothetical protein
LEEELVTTRGVIPKGYHMFIDLVEEFSKLLLEGDYYA